VSRKKCENLPAQAVSPNVYLAYLDLASGSNAVIAQLQDCNGTIVGRNEVIYSNALSNLNANVAYIYSVTGISQCVDLAARPPPPDAFGLSDACSVLQIYTAFTAPQPVATAITNGGTVDDIVLNFGAMSMSPGKALFLDGSNGPVTVGTVSKQWITVSSNQYLVESLPYSEIAGQLAQLPQASILNPSKGKIGHLAFLDSRPRRPSRSAAAGKAMRVASLSDRRAKLRLLLSGAT
jgi:hypothetical protein